MRYRESETLSKREHAIDLREGKRKGKFGKKIINKGIEKKKIIQLVLDILKK